MVSDKNNWSLGEVVILPRATKTLKAGWSKSYDMLCGSRYICIREAANDQRGILVKVLGKYRPNYITTINGQPFCKDELDELFEGSRYLSYSFPSERDVKEVLDILRSNSFLIQKFEEASMHINIKSKFWVNEVSKQLLVLKKTRCYDASTDSLCIPADDDAPYRITLVYFSDGNIDW